MRILPSLWSSNVDVLSLWREEHQLGFTGKEDKTGERSERNWQSKHTLGYP